MSKSSNKKRNIWGRALSIAKLAWPGALVFIAFDLAVDPAVSILRSPQPEWNDLEIVGVDQVSNHLPPHATIEGNANSSEHIMFGVESVAEELAIAGGGTGVITGGGWSGRFAGVLEGDEELNCWSPYEVNVRLRQEGDRIYGPGSYLVDPSDCSSHAKGYLAFFTADGERTGDQVVLEITDDETGELALLFSGIAAGNRIVGAFTQPDGAAVSGTTILTLVDAEKTDSDS